MFIIKVSLFHFNAALMGVICIFARADAAGFTLSVLKELRPERYRVAVENAMVSKLLSLANKMSPLPTVEKFDFAFWVVSKAN